MISEENKFWKLLFQASSSLRNCHARNFPAERPRPEITLSQMRVLGCVFMSPTGCVRVKEIADELGITPGAVSQMVDHLVREGHLERCADENDRRAVAITLSRRGADIHAQLDLQFAELVRRLTGNIAPEKREIFIEVLEELIAALAMEKNDGMR